MQEEKKYRDYEKLVDEIAWICGIRDLQSLKQIACWKAGRRYKLALKYGSRKQAIRALRLLRKYGGLHLTKILKEIIWLYFVNGWMEEHIYPIYRRLFIRHTV